MSDNVERQLLIGMLALQNGFISQEQLVAAFSVWRLDRSRPLEQLLFDSRALDEPSRGLLEALVAQQLRMHGGDARAILASMPSSESFESTLCKLPENDLYGTYISSRVVDSAPKSPDPRVGICVGDRSEPTDEHATIVRETNRTPGDRFVVLRPHAQGGLGVVSVALDKELNRHVALKEIRAERSNESASQHRFVQEAEITGQLEHPGIVPVYGLGADNQGRPFYAMRFVEGETLKSGIREFHKHRPRFENLRGQRAVAFRSLLGRLAHVCMAIEYAHSRGVIHRDIKPDNILMGPYGETLVVDWGLAKTIGAAEPVESPSPSTASRPIQLRSESSHTLEGSAVGTPAYMSPEQASGNLNALGPATDVYSLGATLFQILTGKPPISAESVSAVLEKARTGLIDSIQNHWPSAPLPLCAVSKKAMALHPKDRYSSAKYLAEDIENWLADEPVLAYREPLHERMSRVVRKNPTAVSVGIVLLMAMAGLSLVVMSYRARMAREKAVKDLQIHAAQQNAEKQELFAKITSIRERSTKQSPGWSWLNDQEIVAAARNNPEDALARILREESARLMITPDIRKLDTRVESFTTSRMSWSPDGKILALGQNTASAGVVQIRLLDANTYKPVKSLSFGQSITKLLNLETDGVTALEFSIDGHYLFVGSRAGVVRQYDTGNFELVADWQAHESYVNDFCVSDDGTTLVTLSRGKNLKWWRLPEQIAVQSLEDVSFSRIRKIGKHFLAIGRHVHRFEITAHPDTAVLSNAAKVPILDGVHTCEVLKEGQIVEANHDGFQIFTPEGSFIRKLFNTSMLPKHESLSIGSHGRYVMMYDGQNCNLWEYASGRKIASLSTEDCTVAAVDPFRPRVLISDNRRLDCYEVREDSAWQSLPVSPYIVEHVVGADKNGRVYTSDFVQNGKERQLRIVKWDASPAQVLEQRTIDSNDPTRIAIDLEGKTIAYHNQSTSTLYRCGFKGQPKKLYSPKLNAAHLTFEVGGQHLWFTNRPVLLNQTFLDKVIDKANAWRATALDLESGKAVFEWKNEREQGQSQFSHFSGLAIGQKHLVASTKNDLRIWDIAKPQDPKEFRFAPSIIEKLAIADLSHLAVAGSGSGELYVIDYSAATIDNARILVSTKVHSARITALATIGEHRIVIGDAMGEVSLWLWNGAELQLQARLGPLSNSIKNLTPIDSGRRLVVHIDQEATVRILDLERLDARWEELNLVP